MTRNETLENAIILMIDILCLLIGVGVAFGIRFHLFFGSLMRDQAAGELCISAFYCYSFGD